MVGERSMSAGVSGRVRSHLRSKGHWGDCLAACDEANGGSVGTVDRRAGVSTSRWCVGCMLPSGPGWSYKSVVVWVVSVVLW